MRDNYLRVTLSSKSSTFKEWFFEPNTLSINILSSFDIIDSINNKLKISPEVIIEHNLILLTDSKFNRIEVNITIDLFTNITSSLTFIFTNVFLSE